MIGLMISMIPIALLACVVLVPINIAVNKKKIKEMEKKISDFENMNFSSQEAKDEEKRKVKKELIKIKSGITSKGEVEHARDILEAF